MNINKKLKGCRFEFFILFLANDSLNLDVDVTADDATIGLNLSGDMTKKNIGEDVSIDKPTDNESVTAEEFEEIMQDEIDEGIGEEVGKWLRLNKEYSGMIT